MEDQRLPSRLGMQGVEKHSSGIMDGWLKRCILVDSKNFLNSIISYCISVPATKKWTHCGWKRFSSMKRTISSVNHSFEIKMITVLRWWEKEKGIGGSFHHKAITLGQNVTIYHGWKMTLTVSQGKLLLKWSHLDQYTMSFFFYPLAKK